MAASVAGSGKVCVKGPPSWIIAYTPC